MSKKAPKPKLRWEPLPEDASIMQMMAIPDVDDHTFHFEDISKEELLNLSKLIDQSNKTLEVENMLIERYLSRMDPSALAKMNQILEAAALALQKAERAAFLGSGASTLSVAREGYGSRITDDSSSSSKGGTTKSGSSPVSKLGLFGVGDKGHRVPAAQKIEMVNREIEELRNILEGFRKRAKDFNHGLQCRNEEMTERLQEITNAQDDFDNNLCVQGVDPMTGKLPGEKFLRYLEVKLKGEEMEIDKMRIKTGTSKDLLKRIKQQLAQKEELGEALHAVDFEQLQIENRECQEQLDSKVSYVNDVKRINGRFGTLLSVHRRRLNEQMHKLSELEQNAVVKEKMIKKLIVDEEKVNQEVESAMNAINKIKWIMKSYTCPEVIEYIQKKAEVHEMKKEIKVNKRQMKLKDLAISSQVQKIRSLSEGLSRSQTYASASTAGLKESRIFF